MVKSGGKLASKPYKAKPAGKGKETAEKKASKKAESPKAVEKKTAAPQKPESKKPAAKRVVAKRAPGYRQSTLPGMRSLPKSEEKATTVAKNHPYYTKERMKNLPPAVDLTKL